MSEVSEDRPYSILEKVAMVGAIVIATAGLIFTYVRTKPSFEVVLWTALGCALLLLLAAVLYKKVSRLEERSSQSDSS